MHKRKLIFVLMSALLLSGCNKNKDSSSLIPSSSSIDETTVSETTSESEIIGELEDEERIITAFHNLYLAPAVRFETSAPLLTMEEKVYSETNKLIEEERHEMSLNALTEITNRTSEDVIFKQDMNVEFNDDSMHLLSYYALETLYLSYEDSDESASIDVFNDMALLKYLFGNQQGDEFDFTFIDAFITESDTSEITKVNDKLRFSRNLTNKQFATLLAQVITAGIIEQDEYSEQLLVTFLMIILENYFNFQEMTMVVMVNKENNIEEITLDFAVEVTLLDDLSVFDDFTLTQETISELLVKLITAKTGERTETLVSGELTTTIMISESIDIVAPEDFADYLPQIDD